MKVNGQPRNGPLSRPQVMKVQSLLFDRWENLQRCRPTYTAVADEFQEAVGRRLSAQQIRFVACSIGLYWSPKEAEPDQGRDPVYRLLDIALSAFMTHLYDCGINTGPLLTEAIRDAQARECYQEPDGVDGPVL